MSVVMIAFFATAILATEQQVQAEESTFFGDLGRGLDEAGNDYGNGYQNGLNAGVNGDSSSCPRHGLEWVAYCFGYDGGYARGSNSASDVQQVRGSDNDNDDDDDDDHDNN